MKTENKKMIAFIGLGKMGSGMAMRLVNAGHSVRVYDKEQSSITHLTNLGAESASSPADAAINAEFILLSLPKTEHVEEVLFGNEGIIHTAHPGCVVIDMSTISPDATRSFSEKLQRKGIGMLDVPVSGGSSGALNGTLSAMVGGSEDNLEKAMPILNTLATTITHVGGIGAGQAVKMVNQVVLVGNVMAMSEGLLLAREYGLDLNRTLEAIKGGAAGSWMLSNLASKVIEEDWTPAFTIELQLKDLRIALDTADRLGVPLLQVSQIFQLYRALATSGKSEDGNHSLIQALYALINRQEYKENNEQH